MIGHTGSILGRQPSGDAGRGGAEVLIYASTYGVFKVCKVALLHLELAGGGAAAP